MSDDSDLSIDDAIEHAMNGTGPEVAESEIDKAIDAAVEPQEPKDTPEALPKKLPKWRKEALALYETLDPLIQEEVLKREDDIHRGIEQYRGKATQYESLERVIAPYRESLSVYESPEQAIGTLLQVDYALRYGSDEQKRAIVEHIARDAGIMLGEQPQIPPELQSVMSELNNIKATLTQSQREREYAEQVEAQKTLSDFAKNAPHLDSVRPRMAAYLQSGAASTLQDAYDQACWADPVIRQQLLADQIKAEEAKKTEAAKAAKQAAVTSIPRRGTIAGKSAQSGQSIDEAINDALAKSGFA